MRLILSRQSKLLLAIPLAALLFAVAPKSAAAAQPVPVLDNQQQPINPNPPGQLLPAKPDASADLPDLFRLQKPAVQEAWREIASAMADNQQLSAPLAEPYFARADLWTLVNQHDAALQDYLKGVSVVLASDKYSPDDYLGFIQRMQKGLDALDRIPQPPVPGLSREHYARGVQEYFAHNPTEALVHLTNAIQLEPQQPLNWYFRSLAYKQLGDERRAQHDALMGSHIERRGGQKMKLGKALVRIQGPTRTWLENFRAGDPSQRLVKN